MKTRPLTSVDRALIRALWV